MYLKLAWRNIWRNKRRTFITLASIGFAVFFACLTQSMQLGQYANMINNSVRFYTGYAQIHHKEYWEEKTIDNSIAYDKELIDQVDQTKHVLVSIPRLESFALVSYGTKTKGTMVLGISPEREDKLTNLKGKLISGEYLRESDEAVMIGKGLADYLSANVGDTIALIGQGYRGLSAVGKYPIQGITETPIAEFNNQVIHMPLPAAQNFYGAYGQITSLAVNLEDVGEVEETKHLLISQVDTTDHQVMGWKEMLPGLVQQIELDYVSGKVILYVLYAIIGFGMLGTFLMMAKERTYEFGIMMAIGMKRLNLQLIVLIELVLMGFIGVLVGIFLSLPIIIILHFNPIPLSGELAEVYEKFGIEPVLDFSIAPEIFSSQAVLILILSLILGAYPIWYIRILKLTEAIRD